MIRFARLLVVIFTALALTLPPLAGTVHAQATTPNWPVVSTDANLRAGPGTSFEKLGSAQAGQAMPLSGRNAAGDWVRTNTGAWIAARLVTNAPKQLPIVTGNFAAATPEELQYLKHFTGWFSQLLAVTGKFAEGNHTTAYVDDFLRLPRELSDWRKVNDAPPGLTDLEDWIDQLLDNCVVGNDLKLDDAKLAQCGTLIAKGFIPAKFRGSGAAAPVAAATPIPTKQTPAKTPVATATRLPAATPRPTLAARPTATQTPTPQPTLADPAKPLIPDIAPPDVTLNVKNRGMACEPVNQYDDNGTTWYAWHCTRSVGSSVDLSVDVRSRSLLTVDSIEATILQYDSPSDQAAAPFLGFVATTAFVNDEALQQQARSWVEDTLPTLTGQPGDIATITIGGVELQLYGPDTARVLEIGGIP